MCVCTCVQRGSGRVLQPRLESPTVILTVVGSTDGFMKHSLKQNTFEEFLKSEYGDIQIAAGFKCIWGLFE